MWGERSEGRGILRRVVGAEEKGGVILNTCFLSVAGTWGKTVG